MKSGDPAYFQNGSWPLDLAQQCVSEVKNAEARSINDGRGVDTADKISTVVGLKLAADWKSPLQGGSATIGELRILFNGFGTAKADLEPHPEISVWGVRYLCPFRDAIKTLGLLGQMPTRALIACPGFPKDSFYYVGFDGQFEGHYNRLYLVVDQSEQVVSVQLVDEAAKEVPSVNIESNWHTYNYVNYRVKASTTLRVGHSETKMDSDVLRIDTVLYREQKENLINTQQRSVGVMHPVYSSHALEAVRWYVPRPIANIILDCLNARSSGDQSDVQ